MADDVAAHQPFTTHFSWHTLHVTTDKREANKMEARFIRQFKSRGPSGYNILRGASYNCKQFWAMMHARKRR